MTYAEFQAHWERAAGAEYDAYMRRSAAGLIADARAGRYGECYQLWRAIAARATLPLAGQVLLEVLRRDDPYLVRYHAAKALLALLGTAEFAPVDLSADRAGQEARLDVVERVLRERLGAGAPKSIRDPDDFLGGDGTRRRVYPARRHRTATAVSPGQITDGRPLWDLHQLVVLKIENIPVVRDLADIEALDRLEQLAVEGSVWTTQQD